MRWLLDLEVDVADRPEAAVEARQVLELDDRRLGRRPSAGRAVRRPRPGWSARPGDRRSVGGIRSAPPALSIVHGVLLYHWMCLESRARTISARALRTNIRPRITMIVAAEMPWKSSCGRGAH